MHKNQFSIWSIGQLVNYLYSPVTYQLSTVNLQRAFLRAYFLNLFYTTNKLSYLCSVKRKG